jgi:hypothetical protein
MTPAAPSRFIAVFMAVVVAMAGGMMLFNYVVDPFQYYRAATLFRPVLWGGLQRQQNAGLARNFPRDVVVVGSSVTENFLSADTERIWGKASRRLSISGSTAHEQYLVTNLALRTGKVKEVLWGLDVGAFLRPWEAVRDDQGPFPWHMYRTGWQPNVEYLLSLGTTRLSLAALKKYGDTDFDRYHAWFDKFEYGNAAVLKNWTGTCSQFQQKFMPADMTAAMATMDRYDESLERNLLSLVRAYPDVRFDLYLPPLATLIHTPAKTNMLPILLPFRQRLAERVSGVPNVRLYDFQTVEPIVDDLANFKDPLHFGLPINHYILESIRDDRHRVGRDDMAWLNARLVEIANRYDLCEAGVIPRPTATK